jgi:hypothetical protein
VPKGPPIAGVGEVRRRIWLVPVINFAAFIMFYVHDKVFNVISYAYID